MSLSWTLIEWNKLTTCYDSLRYEELNKPTMTYLDLYQQLSELNSDQLTQTVSIYDKDVEDFSHADSTLININDQIHIGI